MSIKPAWLKIRPPTSEQYSLLKEKISDQQLVTVCQEAHCPNMSVCWSEGTATFMILGDTCTRGCRFCAIKTSAKGQPVDPAEPEKLAATVHKMQLSYLVITSVTRDDLADQGAKHYAECIRLVKQNNPGIIIEVLIPDFQGDLTALKIVGDAEPEVIGHNIETVQSMQQHIRDPRANYEQSLSLLKETKKKFPNILTKSALMLGVGETKEDVLQAMKDLRSHHVDLLAIGQYLQPSKRHYPLQRYVSPEEFTYYEAEATKLGFKYAAAGPFVRSSYKAGELYVENIIRKEMMLHA